MSARCSQPSVVVRALPEAFLPKGFSRLKLDIKVPEPPMRPLPLCALSMLGSTVRPGWLGCTGHTCQNTAISAG